MYPEDTSTRNWDGQFLFAVSVCCVYWALSIAGSIGPGYTITVRDPQFAIDIVINTNFIFQMAAPLLPALYCFVVYPECRSSVGKVNARWRVYFVAIATGLSLPFLSYPGTHKPDFPWGRQVTIHLALVFAKNLFLAPFWEEIVWRGCFQKKIASFSSPSSSILLMSLGCTVWSGGYIAVLYNGGLPIEVLSVLPFTYFFFSVIVGSIFELGHGSLWPCVLLHALFNAGTLVYYSEYDRASELGSYVSELNFTAFAAALFFWAATRRSRVSIQQSV